MTEEQMRAECRAIQAEWQMSGLTGGVYEDFAVELAGRVQAAERERCAAECRQLAAMWRSQDGSEKRAGVAEGCADTILGA